MNRFIKRLPYILCYLVAFVLGMKQLREPDIWWQLLSGRWMLEHRQVTKTDVFSFTMAGRPWVNVKWLYEIIIGLLEKIAGPEGVVLLQAVVNVLIVHFLFKTVKLFSSQLKQPVTDFACAFSALLFLALVEYRMAGRPEMVSHMMCALYLWILWRNPQMEWKKTWWLILLQCLWANMHEGYPVGMVMTGTAIAGSFLSFLLTKNKAQLQQSIRAAIIFAAAGVAILLNPNTIQLWKQPFEIYRQVWANKYTTELYSVSNPDYWTIQAKWHVAILAIVCIFWMIRFIAGRKDKSNGVLLTPVTLTYLLLIPLFGYLSLTANRNIPFTQIILYPSIPYMLMWTTEKLRLEQVKLYAALSKRTVAVITLIAAVFYISIVSNKYYKATKSPNRYGVHVSMLHNPTGAASFIKDLGIKGTAFSDYFVSSYLLWSMYPDFKSYIDLRDLDVFPVPFFDDYFSMYNNPAKFDSLDKIYDFNYIVFSNSQLPGLQLKLYWGEGYNLLYADPVSSVYLKNNEKNEAINHDLSKVKLFTWPQQPEDPAWAALLTKLLNPAAEYTEENERNEPMFAARYYNQLQNYRLSVKILQPAMMELESDAEANHTMGVSLLNFASMVPPQERPRKIDSARIYLNRALELDDEMPLTYAALGDIAMMQNDFTGAGEYYKKSIARDNSLHAVYFNLAMTHYYLAKKTNDRAHITGLIAALEKSLMLNPENKRAYLYLGEAYLKDGKTEKAKKNIKKAASMPDRMYKGEDELLNELKQKLNIP